MILLIKGYQKLISPLFPPSCRFYPTCSTYFLQALGKYGFFKGSYLGMRRIIRCHPWNPGDMILYHNREEMNEYNYWSNCETPGYAVVLHL